MQLVAFLVDSTVNLVILPTGGVPKKDEGSALSHGQLGKPKLGQELRPLFLPR